MMEIKTVSLPHGGVLTRFCAPRATGKQAIIICPGGGYEFCSIREGAPVARAFARRGVEAFVLEYPCENVPLLHRPLHTLAAALSHVRQNAAAYGVRHDSIAACGFSAGGHLAALLGTVWHRAEWFASNTDLQQHRPNALVLCYPVISAGKFGHISSFVRLCGGMDKAYSAETLVDGRTPRTFLWHTLDDQTVSVENTLLFEAALRQADVPHEMHLFTQGVHGLALADFETYDPPRGRLPDRHVARWMDLCTEWLHG